MKLYHYTKPGNVDNILKHGLRPSGLGIVYLTPSPDKWHPDGEICLEVETRELRLTSFEDCTDWEVLCWGSIPPRDIKAIEGVLDDKEMP